MILLRLISWPYARKHLLRTLLTMAGIVLGVAVFVGMHTANESVLAAFHQTIDRIAGSTQLQVSAGEAGFDEAVLDKVREVEGVAAASPVIEASVAVEGVNVLILGVDMLGDRSLRSYDLEDTDTSIDDPLVFLAQPDSLIVTKTFADERGLKVNGKIPMLTMAGDQVFTVRGIMKPGGLASAFGGNLAIMDIYAAQKVFGRGYKFDRVDLALDEGVSLEEGARRVQAAVGDGLQVEPPSSRGEQFESTSRLYATASNITSLFALFIGVFIIYNTFAIAVTERRREIGILRALGATQAQIRTLFLVESAVAGLAGTAVGVLFGIALAQGMAAYIGGLLTEVYGVAQSTGEVTPAPWILAAAAGVGLATSLLAAWLPARGAARVDPVKALQKGREQSVSAGENRMRRRWAALCAAGAIAAFAFSRIGWVFYAGYLLAVLTAVLLSPAMASWVARAIRPVMARLRPVEGTLAVDSLLQAPKRTSGTIAALMLSVALVISLSGLARASYNSLDDWMRVALSPDLYVTTAETVSERTFTFPESLGDELRLVDGVGTVQEVRGVRVLVDGSPIMLFAVDVDARPMEFRLQPVEGNAEEIYRAAAQGKGVIAADSYARLHGVQVGDTLGIAAPGGMLRLPLLGTVHDFSDQQGSILMDRDLYVEHWNDTAVNNFQIFLKPSADAAQVRQRILREFGERRRLFVLTNQDLRDFVNRLTDQWFGLTYIQIAVAVLVAILGIVNALTVSITDRRRELGVLRAVGGLRNQIRHTIWMEAAAIGFIGLVLGFAVGAVQLWYSVEVARRDLIGIDIGYAYPFTVFAMLIPIILGTSLLAAIGPSESAVRGSLVEALEYE